MKQFDEEIVNRMQNMAVTDSASTSTSANARHQIANMNREQLIEIVKLVTQSVCATSNNTNDPYIEELKVDFSNRASANETEKIPDAVKCLREFTGKVEEFSSWRKSVDRLLEMYSSFAGSAKYYAILHMIRHKIVGDADSVLESYRTPLDWGQIKKCLMMHYSDKRDISTLEYQMTILTQRNDPITIFYQKIYQHLSLILNKIDCLNLSEETLVSMTNMYRDKALDTFIRGLNGDLPRLLSIKEPASLPQALHLCLKLDNMNYRINHAHNQHANRNFQGSTRLAPKPQNFSNYKQQNNSGRNFFPELTHFPKPQYGANQQSFRNQNFIRNNTPFSQRNIPPLPPRPQPRPEPMDIDQSIHSAQVNYKNRPQNYQFTGRNHQQRQNYIQGNSNQIHHAHNNMHANKRQASQL